MAASLWKLVCRTVKHRAMSMAHFLDVPPGQLVLLVSEEPASVQSALLKQKLNWSTLMVAEMNQWRFPEVGKVISNVGFLFNGVVSVMLVHLAQHDFRCVPPAVETVVEAILGGFCNTVICERAFQKLKDHGRCQKNSRMSRVRKWYVPSSQGLMKEMGRQEVEPSREPLPGDVPRRLPTAMFEAMSSRDTSIPLDDLQGIKSGRTKGYPSTSAQGLQVQVAAWRLLVEAHTADMFHKLQDRYLATLLQEDGIVVNQATCQCHIVLKTCAYGALLWPCSKHEEAGFRYFTPCVEPGVQASWKAVLDADAWLSIPCVAVPPVVLCCLVGHHSELPTGVVALQTGDDTIWRGAARAGFKGVTESSMNKTIDENHLLDGMEEDEKPKGLLPKVELLVLFFLPGLPDEELAAIIKERAGITRRQRRSLTMLAENLEHATGCLDPTDHMDAKEHKATAHAAELSMKSQTSKYLADRKFIDPVTVERELIERGANRHQSQQPH